MPKFSLFFSGRISLEKINPESPRGSGLQNERQLFGKRAIQVLCSGLKVASRIQTTLVILVKMDKLMPC
jgi:hypothetical protein